MLVNHGGAGLTYVMPDLIGTFGKQVGGRMRSRGFRITTNLTVPYPGLMGRGGRRSDAACRLSDRAR